VEPCDTSIYKIACIPELKQIENPQLKSALNPLKDPVVRAATAFGTDAARKKSQAGPIAGAWRNLVAHKSGRLARKDLQGILRTQKLRFR
jgi:delta-aminolevulinic acid dehydratase/porphobilinogen synthase